MRYFRRTGQQVVMQESAARGARLVDTGDILAYDDAYDDEKHWAAQCAGDRHHYVEVDANGVPLTPGPTVATVVVDGPLPPDGDALADAGLDPKPAPPAAYPYDTPAADDPPPADFPPADSTHSEE